MLAVGNETMNFSEFIGFIITMVILVFLFFRQLWEQQQRAKYPEKYEQEEREREEALQEFLESLDGDKKRYKDVLEEAPPAINPPAPPPLPEQPKRQQLTEDTRFHFDSVLEDYETHTRVEDLELKTKIGQQYQNGPRKIFKKRVFDAKLGTGDVGDEYAIKIVPKRSRAKNLVKESRALKNQIIVRDILGPPKGLR